MLRLCDIQENLELKLLTSEQKNMIDHVKTCGQPDTSAKKQSDLTAYFQHPARSSLPQNVKMNLRRSEAFFVGSGLPPFSVVDSKHLRLFCQSLIQLGAQHGNVNADNVLVGRKIVRNDIVKLAYEVKSSIIDEVKARAVPDLLLGNPAGAGCCQICKANPAGAGAGFHHAISHQ